MCPRGPARGRRGANLGTDMPDGLSLAPSAEAEGAVPLSPVAVSGGRVPETGLVVGAVVVVGIIGVTGLRARAEVCRVTSIGGEPQHGVALVHGDDLDEQPVLTGCALPAHRDSEFAVAG